MSQILSFNKDPKLKEDLVSEMKMHQKQDADKLIFSAIKNGAIRVNVNTGEIFGNRWKARKERGCINSKGYLVFTLHWDGRRKQIKAHRAVWIAANGVPPLSSLIDHINRVKDDNRIENLRLADPVLNSKNRRSYKGEANPSAKITKVEAKEIREVHVPRKYSYPKIAKQFGVSASLVAKIIRGELWVN